MFIKIWERYIFREFLKVFALFLLGFYLLYVVIDYSTHMQDFVQGNQLPFWKILQYYVLQFIKRADILLPLATLIASIKVLCQLNTHKELVAFQSAGIKQKKLLRPLLYMALLCSFATLAVNEFAVPYSLNFIDKFHDAHLRHSFRGKRSDPLSVIHLDDHSKLIYQSYDTAKESFFDVIWIRNANDIWRMKYLKADPDHPQGQWADHITRNEAGVLEKSESFSTHVFKDLSWRRDLPRKGLIPFENRSIRELTRQAKEDLHLSKYEKQELLTQLLFKWTMPFLSILVLIAIAPSCIRYKRHLPQFFIYTFAVFAFVAFVAFMDAAVILGENEIVSPHLAILAPFAILFTFFGWRFARAR